MFDRIHLFPVSGELPHEIESYDIQFLLPMIERSTPIIPVLSLARDHRSIRPLLLIRCKT
jgi:hypothetical protein